MGITHIVIDIPTGKGTKVQNMDDAQLLKEQFVDLFKKVGIICEVYLRVAKGPDGVGIGPNMEMKETLKILERKDDRGMHLESIATDMAGIVIEMSGKAAKGEGKSLAVSKLNSGEALEKFWDIATTQGATSRLKSEEIPLASITHDIIAVKEGIIDSINNREIVKIAKSIGNPAIKDAGIYVHKMQGDTVKVGDKLMTLYATSSERMEHALKALDLEALYSYI
jgi:AMP phosphorylase